MSEPGRGLTPVAAALKRGFDLGSSIVALTLTSWLIVLSWVMAWWATGRNGFFTQERVGRYGKPFRVIRLRTMRFDPELTTTVTTSIDTRITLAGRFLRRTKLDELPQVINVVKGDMSFVGPRPDVPGFADTLEGPDRIILTVRPGITGPATLKYRNEEELLAGQSDPERYNREVIYPDKVRLNRQYVENYSFFKDLRYLMLTILG